MKRHSAQAVERGAATIIVCGHIHEAGVVERDGFLYCNDGGWVESCTTLVEPVRDAA